ncbi:SurA N-terminal domain-containing protein [Pelagibacterales bacterium SAG-MED07]|nr:SurA N-terminal domain-containing protein [Pelagibacterales bacterium SAG-MED07]
MISSFRNFAKTKFAGVLVFVMIIPFVFWGMGSMFSSGNTNNIAKINKINISTQDFIDHINKSNIPEQTIKANLDKDIIEELLSTLVSTTLLDLEVKDFDILVSKETLSKKIKSNKNFLNDNGNFDRMKYEKFLLENNQSAPGFELRLRGRELQKNLFDYIGAGTTTPKFLTKNLFEEENKKLEIEFIDLENFYKKKNELEKSEINDFLKENEDKLMVEYIDFDYAIINPKNLIGTDEFNQAFFDQIDKIEIEISNNKDLESIVSNFDIKPINVTNFKYSSEKKDVEKKIFEVRNIKFDIIENENDYIIYKIKKLEMRAPDLNDPQLKNEILELLFQKNKFDYNKKLLKKINEKKFNVSEFKNLGKDKIENLILSSIKDNKKFEINSIELLYSLPVNSFTLVNDDKNNIYLVNIKKIVKNSIENNEAKLNEYAVKENRNNRNSILKTYDLLLNEKYNVVLNQKTIERVKNFFK